MTIFEFVGGPYDGGWREVKPDASGQARPPEIVVAARGTGIDRGDSHDRQGALRRYRYVLDSENRYAIQPH
jgi:hypothetical protein